MGKKIHAFMRSGNDADRTEYYTTYKKVQMIFEHDVAHDMVVGKLDTATGEVMLGTYSKEQAEAMFRVRLKGYNWFTTVPE